MGNATQIPEPKPTPKELLADASWAVRSAVAKRLIRAGCRLAPEAFGDLDSYTRPTRDAGTS